MTGTATPTGFVGWVLNYGQIVAFFAQLIYWTVLSVVSVYAVMLFKRLVDLKAGIEPKTKDAEKKAVAVEDFTD